MRIDQLNGDREWRDLIARVRRLETATPLSNTSVGRGRLRMYDNSELLIEDGNLTITGVATVNGQLVGTGTFTWTGPTNLNGPTNLRGNMAVTGGGKVTVGAATLSPTAAGGDPGLGSTSGLGLKAASAIVIDAPSVIIDGTVSLSSIWSSLPTTPLPGNVRCDPLTGKFSRSTAV